MAASGATVRARESGFFTGMAVVAIGVGLIGFSTTFLAPMAAGRFVAPPVIHIHAALFFAWLAFLLTQVRLVSGRRTALHRRAGWAGLALAAAMAVSGVGVGLFAARRDLAAGLGEVAHGQFLTVCIEMLVFAGLVGAAIVYRRRPDVHKRLLLLATISILGPAWFRFRHLFPSVDHPLMVFSAIADSLVIVAAVADRLNRGRFHPTYLWVGSAMVAVHAGEIFLFDTAPYRVVAQGLALLFGLA